MHRAAELGVTSSILVVCKYKLSVLDRDDQHLLNAWNTLAISVPTSTLCPTLSILLAVCYWLLGTRNWLPAGHLLQVPGRRLKAARHSSRETRSHQPKRGPGQPDLRLLRLSRLGSGYEKWRQSVGCFHPGGRGSSGITIPNDINSQRPDRNQR